MSNIKTVIVEYADGNTLIVSGIEVKHHEHLNYSGRDVPEKDKERWIEHMLTWESDRKKIHDDA